MATGYNIFQPSGYVKNVQASTMEERFQVANSLLEQWQGYCEANWVSANGANPYSPENKVKSFLSSLGYFLMMGSTDGIVTDYKQMMNGKREIPVSSCPSFIEDAVYSGVHGSCGNSETLRRAENECFRGMMEKADDKAAKRYKRLPSRKVRRKTRFDRSERLRREMGIQELVPAVVDTENTFLHNGTMYRIDGEKWEKYDPKETKSGMLYDMDKIYCAVDKNGVTMFFDGELERIPDEAIVRRCDAEC